MGPPRFARRNPAFCDAQGYHNHVWGTAPTAAGPSTVNAPEAQPLVFQPGGACRRPCARGCAAPWQGDVLFDRASRGRYATDASIYQVEPVGVLVPRTDADVRAAFDVCRELGVPLLPRGAGSSQCGQTVGAALVVDHSKHLNGVVAFDRDARTVTVEPGIVLDALNAWLEAARPVVSGRRQHVGAMHAGRHGRQQLVRLALDRLRQHGAQRARDRGAACRRHDGALRPGSGRWTARRRRVRELVDRLRALGARERDEIERQVPKVMRRVGGYNIDLCCPQSERPYTADGSVNYAHLLVGSEGTLAWTRDVTLKLAPPPRHRALGVVNFPTLYKAMDAARHIVELGPSAVELVDRTMIDLARGNPAFRPVIDARADRRAAMRSCSWSSSATTRRRAGAALDDLVALMGDLGLPGSVVRMTDAGGAEGAVGGAQGRAQHHDEHEGRRQAGVVHRGLRGAARASGRLRGPADRGVPQARHARHLVCARVGGNAARAADPRHAPRRRGEDARDRRGSERDGARVQGRVLRRARRRPRAQRMGRVAVRAAADARVRGNQGRCSIPPGS